MKLPIIWDPYADFVPHVLPNGLTVYMMHMPNQPGLAMECVVHSGSLQDPEGQAGIAHFVEHLVSQNTILPYERIGSSIEILGGDVGLGATSDLYTSFSCYIPTNEHIVRNILDLFGHMLLQARLRNDVENQRHIIIEEYRRNLPSDIAVTMERAEHEALYADTPRASREGTLGTPESVAAITQSQLQAFYDAHYTPANMSVVMVGGISVAEMLQAIHSSTFDGVRKSGTRTKQILPETPVRPLTVNSFDLSMSSITKATMSTGIYRTVAKMPSTIDWATMSVFCGSLNRVLNAHIRGTKGWTYGIKASWGYRHPFREFTIGSNNIALEAIDLIDDAVADCIAWLPQKKEVIRTVTLGMMNSEVMGTHTPQSICSEAAADLAKHDRIQSMRASHEQIESVTPADLEQVASYLEREYRWVRIIRP